MIPWLQVGPEWGLEFETVVFGDPGGVIEFVHFGEGNRISGRAANIDIVLRL